MSARESDEESNEERERERESSRERERGWREKMREFIWPRSHLKVRELSARESARLREKAS